MAPRLKSIFFIGFFVIILLLLLLREYIKADGLYPRVRRRLDLEPKGKRGKKERKKIVEITEVITQSISHSRKTIKKRSLRDVAGIPFKRRSHNKGRSHP